MKNKTKFACLLPTKMEFKVGASYEVQGAERVRLQIIWMEIVKNAFLRRVTCCLIVQNFTINCGENRIFI